MQGYPFGEFLFWNIEPARSADYRYYGFVREYHQRDNPHCPDLGPVAEPENHSSSRWPAAVDCIQHRTARFDGRQAPLQVVEQSRCISAPRTGDGSAGAQ